ARQSASRHALLHVLEDVQRSNERLANGRKAMIHIMEDLRQTTDEVQRRERELREKQEQLVQAGKLATVGELATGTAPDRNTPQNNIGLFGGTAIDRIELAEGSGARVLEDLRSAMQQVGRAAEITSPLRPFGRVAPARREPVRVHEVVRRSLS